MNITKNLSVLLLSSCLCHVALATESINYSYSEYNQLQAVDNGVSKLEYNYLPTGQLSGSKTSFYLTNTQSGFNYVYDDINRLVLIKDSEGNQSHFIYDHLGYLILVQYQSASSASLQDAVSLKYNQKGQLTERLSYLSNTTEVLLYDGLGRLAKQLVYQGVDGQRNVLLSSLSYEYDALGRIIEKVRVNAERRSGAESYVYDQMNQLSQYSCSGLLCPEDDEGNALLSETYQYNAMGNLLTVESHYANGGYSQMIYQYDGHYPDRLKSYTKDNTTYNFRYDQMGNMVIDDQGNQVHYNGFGRIDQVIQPNTNQSSNYYYNGLNELVSVKHNNHYEQYLYSQLGLMGVDSLDSTNNEITNTQRYIYAGSDKVGVFNQSKDNQSSYQGYIKDYAGSILALVERTDEVASEIVQSYRYTPYGEITKTQVQANPSTSQLGYNGELTDKSTSWQLLGRGTRAYNPRLRQFTSSDTWSPFGKGGINTYAYLSQANPIMYSDPSGHAPLKRTNAFSRKGRSPLLEESMYHSANESLNNSIYHSAEKSLYSSNMKTSLASPLRSKEAKQNQTPILIHESAENKTSLSDQIMEKMIEYGSRNNRPVSEDVWRKSVNFYLKSDNSIVKELREKMPTFKSTNDLLGYFEDISGTLGIRGKLNAAKLGAQFTNQVGPSGLSQINRFFSVGDYWDTTSVGYFRRYLTQKQMEL